MWDTITLPNILNQGVIPGSGLANSPSCHNFWSVLQNDQRWTGVSYPDAEEDGVILMVVERIVSTRKKRKFTISYVVSVEFHLTIILLIIRISNSMPRLNCCTRLRENSKQILKYFLHVPAMLPRDRTPVPSNCRWHGSRWDKCHRSSMFFQFLKGNRETLDACIFIPC